VWLQATQLRVGMTVIYNKDPHRVMTVQHITPGNKRGMMQTKLRNLRSGTQSEARFRSDERVERASLEQHEMEYLYAAGEEFVFMNTETFEQLHLDPETLGDAVKYLLPNNRITIEFFEGRPVGIELPKTVDIKVTYTEPGVKGATATNAPKPATLETGLTLQVPTFIEIDDVIRVDTTTGEYLSRA
jgi:elongation factor P